MNDSLVGSVTTVFLAIIGVGFLAVFLSKNSNTAAVITSGGQAFTAGLGAAVAPVTQAGFGASL